MKMQWLALSRQYQAALQKHLQQGRKSSLLPAIRLGRQAVTLGMETLDLARIHKTALRALALPADSAGNAVRMVKQAGLFFTEALTSIERTHRAGIKTATQLNRRNKALSRRTAQLAAANRHLKQGVVRRKAAQQELKNSGRYHARLLRESRQLQEHLQYLTHRVLAAREDQQKDLSRDLRDEVAQTLLGINVRLLVIKKGVAERGEGLAKEIATTQRVVEKSVKTINRFARKFGTQHEA
jgi:signal transduction histidine kinase